MKFAFMWETSCSSMRTQFSYRLTHTRPRNTENSSFYVRCTEIKKRSQTEKKYCVKLKTKRRKFWKSILCFKKKQKKLKNCFKTSSIIMEKWVKENICEQILYLSRTEERKTWFKFNKIDEWKQQTNEKLRRKKTFVLVNLLNEMTKRITFERGKALVLNVNGKDFLDSQNNVSFLFFVGR